MIDLKHVYLLQFLKCTILFIAVTNKDKKTYKLSAVLYCSLLRAPNYEPWINIFFNCLKVSLFNNSYYRKRKEKNMAFRFFITALYCVLQNARLIGTKRRPTSSIRLQSPHSYSVQVTNPRAKVNTQAGTPVPIKTGRWPNMRCAVSVN